MKKQILARKGLIAAGIVLVAAGTMFAGKLVERIIATVNGENIFMSEFNKNCDYILNNVKQNQQQELTSENVNKIKESVLQQMIVDRLLLQTVEKEKITVAKRELESRIETFKKGYGSEKEFKQALKEEGMDYDAFVKKIEQQIAAEELIQREVRADIKVTRKDKEVLLKNLQAYIAEGEAKEFDEQEEQMLIMLSRTIDDYLFSQKFQKNYDEYVAGLKLRSQIKINGID